MLENSIHLTTQEKERIDELVDAYEEDWRSGTPPVLEERLDGEGAWRRQLLAEFLAVDWYWRQRQGQPLTLEELRARFPDDVNLVEIVIHREEARCKSPEANPQHTSFVPEFPDRFTAVTEIARGGMGAVWRVLDHQFNRPLAVKVMLPKHAAVEATVARFERESQLTGSLQHPAIPPVVDCGKLKDGGPYFSMKLIEGVTLADLLDDQGKSSSERQSELLGLFEQACQAVAYAHSLGVIHRDLKPSNIMVGAFGEVQVMDWGMAKILKDGLSMQRAVQLPARNIGVDDDTLLMASEDGTCDNVTHDGTVMGTPAYMPPEQARGEVHLIDRRTDVFSLGAILFQILTGERPFRGPDAVRQAAAAELEPAYASLAACAADKQLVDLCKRCLAAAPADRPCDAGAVESEIRRWQASVQQRLEREKTERAAAEAGAAEAKKRVLVERSRRRVGLALAGAVLLICLGSGAATWWYLEDQRAKETAATVTSESAETDISELLSRAEVLRDNFDYDSAASLLDQAAARTPDLLPPQSLTNTIDQAKNDLAMVKLLDEIRLQTATWNGEGFEKEFALGKSGAYNKAFADFGIEIVVKEESPVASGLLGVLERIAVEIDDPTVDAAAEMIKSSAIKSHLLAALDAWADDDKPSRRRILAIARNATEDLRVQKLRNASIPLAESTEFALAEMDTLSPSSLQLLANRLEESSDARLVISLRRRGALLHPRDFWTQFNAAVAETEKKRVDAAIGYYQVAISVRPEAVVSYLNLATLVKPKDRIVAENILRKATQANPDSAVAQLRFADLLEDNYRHFERVSHSSWITPQGATDGLGVFNLVNGVGIEEQFLLARRREVNTGENSGNPAQFLENDLRLKEAEGAYRKAVELQPEFAEAQCKFGMFLATHRSEFENADKHILAGLETGSPDQSWYIAAKTLHDKGVRLIKLERKLTEFESNKASPGNINALLELAEFALSDKKRPTVAAELFELAIDDSVSDEKLVWEASVGAAAAHILAAPPPTNGNQMDQITDAERAHWARGAELLAANIPYLEQELDGGEMAKGWLADTTDAHLRDNRFHRIKGAYLNVLPEDVQAPWNNWWKKVVDLRNKSMPRQPD